MSLKLVLDTSVIIKWLNKQDETGIDQADKIMEDVLNDKVELLAPELSKYEIGNVLLKGKKLDANEAYISLNTAYSLPIHFINESIDLAKETYNIAFKSNISYYDASFMALAKLYDATLITDNIKHQGKNLTIKVISLQEYKKITI